MTMVNFKNIASFVWPRVRFFYSEAEGVSGGVATFYNLDPSNGSLIYCTKFYLITKHKIGDNKWNTINIYAPNTRVGRRKFWNRIFEIIIFFVMKFGSLWEVLMPP